MDAVVFDLFGALVGAPTAEERRRAAERLSTVLGCETSAVDRYFLGT